MPELPEVETIVRSIRPQVVGRRIRAVRVTWARTLGGMEPRVFARRLRGLRITAVARRAKHFVLAVPGPGRPDQALVGHLRMSGRLVVQERAAAPSPWLRVALDLDDGRSLGFVDVRKFGRLELVDAAAVRLADLGPEPLEAAFDDEAFARCLAGRRRGLKAALLDPRVIAGIGNIYADESLHAARLHPLVRADTLRAPARRRLRAAIVDVLEAALAQDGSSFDTFYRTPDGQPGRYQEQFAVYGRTGRPCRRCRAPIRRLVVAGRGTHVCLRCQRPPRR
jgi:formamidopyrimidine-DNA glycosylase